MSNKPSTGWEELKAELEINPEQELEIQLQMDLINAVIEARESKKLTQRELSKQSGIKQPSIARIEKGINSTQTRTLIKLLKPMGYTIRVVPIQDNIRSGKE